MALSPSTTFNVIFLFLSVSLTSSASRHSTFHDVDDNLDLPTTSKLSKHRLYYDSWRLSVETNNFGSWDTIPMACVKSVKKYMHKGEYKSDLKRVAHLSLTYAKSMPIQDDGKDAWVFDIDETLLSNLDYYAANGYGSKPYNETTWNKWAHTATAPATTSSVKLYKRILKFGFKIFILTGRDEEERNITVKNLLFAGYHNWTKLIVRQKEDAGTKAIVFKAQQRAKLEKQGFRIHGCSGDQWSDLLGSPTAKRLFKYPNPLYYIE